MPKKSKKQITVFDQKSKTELILDSKEELQFYYWLIDAEKLGIVKSWEYHPDSFLLTEKTNYIPLFDNPKGKEKFLMHEHVYTADFKFVLAGEYGEALHKAFLLMESNRLSSGDFEIYVDTKGTFMIGGTDRAFSINKKLVWEKYGIYVNKVVTKLFLQKYGCPAACKITPKTKKPCQAFASCQGLEEVFSR
jgi:hypothetical protein